MALRLLQLLPYRLPVDSVPVDTLLREYAIVFSGETGGRVMSSAARDGDYRSWVMTGLILLFVIICLRVKSSTRYLQALVRDLTEVRERHNAFDETVRETSLLVMLNIFWSCCAGVLLYSLLAYTGTPHTGDSIKGLAPEGLSTLICIGIALGYTLIMSAAYWLVGNVFSDALHSRMWVKGFAAAQGLSVAVMFPLALGEMCYPECTEGILIGGGIAFLLSKLIFIVKGFRIFFTQISSWVLFLYYLCSLEIVPLVLTYLAANLGCRSL